MWKCENGLTHANTLASANSQPQSIYRVHTSIGALKSFLARKGGIYQRRVAALRTDESS